MNEHLVSRSVVRTFVRSFMLHVRLLNMLGNKRHARARSKLPSLEIE